VRFPEFVEAHLGKSPGALVELESGARLGRHSGVWFHTIGQRQGLRLSGGPWYVAAKDVPRNIVYVSRAFRSEEAPPRNAFRCGRFAWTGDARPPSGRVPPATWPLRVKVRHGPESYGAVLHWESPAERETAEQAAEETAWLRYDAIRPKAFDPPPQPSADAQALLAQRSAVDGEGGATARVLLDGSDAGLAAGQYAVFYDARGVCLGCAVILQGLSAGEGEEV